MNNREISVVTAIRSVVWAGVVSMAWLPLAANAQTTTWQVVAGEHSSVVAAELPPGVSRQLTEASIGDAGASAFGFRASSPASAEGYWAWRAGALRRYARTGVAGAPGPGRGGAEAAHVFLSLANGGGSASPDGQRAFLGRAGDPASTLTASYGVWRWDGSVNVEVARGGTDGILGPGLGANWVFPNTSTLGSARMLDAGVVVFTAEVTSPFGESSRIIARHLPGVGNQPCMRTGTTEAALAPGLVPGDSFQLITASLERVGAATDGRIYARLPASGSREGIWVLCAGAPRAIAADEVAGVLGPDVGIAGSIFTNFDALAPQPSGNGVTFFANWRAPAAATHGGLFRHDGTQSRGIAFHEASGYYGPNFSTSTWRAFNSGSLSVSGLHAAFTAGLDTPDNGDPTGLWRVRAGDRPELVALLALSHPDYVPEDGRTWRSFDAVAVFHNGDIVLEATTNPGATKDLWLLARGRAPRRLLSLGQSITVPTTQGPVTTTVTSFNVDDGGARFADGSDTWVAADGSLFLSATVASLGTVLISTRLAVPHAAAIHVDGFE
jgi:hypothetical protein